MLATILSARMIMALFTIISGFIPHVQDVIQDNPELPSTIAGAVLGASALFKKKEAKK